MPQTTPSKRTYLSSFPTCLAIVPNAREVGLAVMDHGGLVHYQVLNLRNHPIPEGREAAFRYGVATVLQRHPQINRVAVALPNRYQQHIPLIHAERAWLEQEARELRLAYAEYDLNEARCWYVDDQETRSTRRALAFLLADEFPELAPILPYPDKSKKATYRFRYWSQAFSAVVLAKFHLEHSRKPL